MKTLQNSILEIRNYLVSSDQGEGVVLVAHDVDQYDWYPVRNLEEAQKMNNPDVVYIPFLESHRTTLKTLSPSDQDYLIMSHIADIAIALMVQERKQVDQLYQKLRKGADKTNAGYSTKKRQEAAKKAWKKRRK